MAQPEKGALIAVALDGPDAVAAIVAEWDEGRAVLPLDPRAPAPERRQILDAVRPTHQLGEWGVRALPGGTPVDPSVAAVLATSGTAGEPKGVELTFAGLAASAQACRQALEARTGRVSRGQDPPKPDQNAEGGWLCCLPLHGVGGLGVVGRAWSTGAPLEVVARFDLAAVAASTASFVSLVPTTLRRCLDDGVDLSRFHSVLVGGAPLEPALRARADAAGASVIATYGLTETWGGVVYDGRVLDGVEVRLGDDDEILVRGPMVMRGYRLRPDDTAAVLSSDGWLRTGDAGAWEDGADTPFGHGADTPFGHGARLTVVDRLRDLIVSGGVNVSPTEVESVLQGHPGVVDVGVVGSADAEWGERVVAHVVATDPENPPTLADLRTFAAEQLSTAKLPRQLVLVTEVPRTSGGKTLRRLLQGLKTHENGDDPPV